MPRPKDSGSDDLFQLIKSLSKSEKRYFNLHVGKNTSSKYLRLFKLISSQNTYDEAALKEKLKGDAMLNNFHVAKKYLFEQIMDALVLYHKDKNINSKLQNLLLQIGICNKKGLSKASQKLLKNAEKIAIKNEKYNFLLEILSLKKSNLMDRSHKGYELDAIKEISTSEAEAISKIEHIIYYKTKIVELFAEYIKWEGIRKPKKSAFFHSLSESEYFNDEKYADSFEAKILLYTLKGYYYHELGIYNKSLSYRKNILELIESNKTLYKIYSRNYLVAFHNYITDLRMLKRYSDMEMAIEKYFAFPTDDFSSEADQFRRYYIMLTQWMIDTMKFDKLLESERKFKDLVSKYQETISESIAKVIRYQFALCHLFSGNINESIDLFMEIIHTEDNSRDISTVGYCHIWLMIANYELKSFSILPYLGKSALHFFKKHRILFKIEKELLNFFMDEKNFEQKMAFSNLDKFLTQKLKPSDDKNKTYSLMHRWIKNKVEAL